MRPRYQQGQICKRGSNWVLRYHEDRIVDGKVKRVRTVKALATYSQYPFRETEADISRLRRILEDKIKEILVPVNRQNSGNGADETLTLGEFIEQRYFPRLEQRLQIPAGNELHIEPSTVWNYGHNYRVHVKDSPFAKVRLRDFTAREGQQFLESLPQHLSHQTHLRIKNLLSGIFTWAIASGVLKGPSPMDGTKAGGQRKKADPKTLSPQRRKTQASNEHAYTLEEVAEMLDELPDPARTVCAVAAFTGLSRSELRGLKWADYDGETIRVRRKIWNNHIGPPKTQAREAGVFVIPLLRKILAKYKKDFPPGEDNWVFRGERSLRPLNLDNLSRQVIPYYINGAWFGWHSFRRGLGTRLNEAGVDDKDIQSILRHGNIATTQAFYILPSREQAEAGLKKLDKTLRQKYGIKA
jgi:integrase